MVSDQHRTPRVQALEPEILDAVAEEPNIGMCRLAFFMGISIFIV